MSTQFYTIIQLSFLAGERGLCASVGPHLEEQLSIPPSSIPAHLPLDLANLKA